MNFSHIIYSFINILNEMSPYILLGFLIAGLLHVFVNEATLTRHLSGKGLKPIIKAAAIGIPLPLCSCGVLPTAVSLRRQGASKAATTSFLIATPQTGVDSIAATYSLLGAAFAIIRPIAALVGAVFGGYAVEKFDVSSDEKFDSSKTIQNCKGDSCCSASPKDGNNKFFPKIGQSIKYGFVDMIENMGKWLVIGLIIATLITIFVPDSFFTGFREYPLIAMIVVVLIAVPMYICATGSIPIAMSLMLKGLTPGAAFVLLMAGPAANFASILILNKTQGRRATTIYVLSVIITSIVFGLIIDYLLPSKWFAINGAISGHCEHLHFGIFESICSVILVLLLLFSAIRVLAGRKTKNHQHHHISSQAMEKKFKIIGMNCGHCKATVEKAIKNVKGVESVEINLSAGQALITGDFNPQDIFNAVEQAGFDIENIDE